MIIVFKAIYIIILIVIFYVLCAAVYVCSKCVKDVAEKKRTKMKEESEILLLAAKIKDVQEMAGSWQIGSHTPVSVYNLNTKMFTHYKEIYDALSAILKILPNSNENTKQLTKRFIEETLEDLTRDYHMHKKQRWDVEVYSIPLAAKRNASDLIKRLEDECVGELANIRSEVLKVLNTLRAGCVFTDVNYTNQTTMSNGKENASVNNNGAHRYTENDLDKIQNSLDVIKKYCIDNDDMGVLTDILELLKLSLEISKNADDSRMYKKFNTYYMPEMLQMIEQLADLLNTKTTSYVSSYTNERIEKIQQMLRDLKDPFGKILKSLLQEDITEFDVNLDTMRDMLRMDGLIAD